MGLPGRSCCNTESLDLAAFAFQDGLNEWASESAASGLERDQAKQQHPTRSGRTPPLARQGISPDSWRLLSQVRAKHEQAAMRATLSSRPRQGAKLTQLMGPCRACTHIPMALCVAPAPWRSVATTKTGNVYRQAAGPRSESAIKWRNAPCGQA